jgi:SAM-dependent methyltransferase
MVSDGELNYFDAIGEQGRRHAIGKPFSDPDRGPQLQQIGALLSVLPEPPARLLDCGCGTGWLTWMLQRCGYAVTGLDVAAQAVELAQSNPPFTDLAAPQFVVAPVEAMPFENAFDAVIFFDSLHHSVDERAALRSAFRALVPGGVLITSEPGKGHAAASSQQMSEFGVTERDMPAGHIRKVGEEVGFVHGVTLARADAIGRHLYGPVRASKNSSGWRRLEPLTQWLRLLRTLYVSKRDNGLVILHKPLDAVTEPSI